MKVTLFRLLTGLAVVGFATSCTDSSGVDGMGAVEVTLQQSTAPVLDVSGAPLDLVDLTSGSLDPDTVASLTMTVTAIQFLEGASGDGITNTSWVDVTLPTPVTLDLMALPTDVESPLVLASGSVPVGPYRHLRLYVQDAEIVFTGPIVIGQAATFDGATPYPVVIPSVDETGINTDVEFTVIADDVDVPLDVSLLFSLEATFANATTNGADTVMLTPIIAAQPRTSS